MKFLLSIFLWIIIITKIWSQEIPYIEYLSHREGKVETYYTKGSESKAEYLQMLLEDAMRFYGNKLKDTFDLKLLVLNKEAWKYYATGPYPLSEFRRSPDRIILPDANIYKIKLPSGKTLFGRSEVYFWDFIAAHELGHYISVRFNARSHTLWLSEFFADYIQVGYMAERMPEFRFPQWWFSMWTILPFKYKTLKDLEYGKYINPANYSFYEAKFFELVSGIFEKRNYLFLYDYINTFRNINENYSKQEGIKPDRNHIIEFSIAYIKNSEPAIFNAWYYTMRKSFHYYLIAIGLIILVVYMKIINKSYPLLKSQGFKLKRINRISGVSAVKILILLKKIKDKKIKRRLYLAVASSVVMCFSLVCLLFWIALFFLVRI